MARRSPGSRKVPDPGAQPDPRAGRILRRVVACAPPAGPIRAGSIGPGIIAGLPPVSADPRRRGRGSKTHRRQEPSVLMAKAKAAWGIEVGSAAIKAVRLERDGLVRLRRDDLTIELPAHFKIETNLSDGPLKLFDALFYWFD